MFAVRQPYPPPNCASIRILFVYLSLSLFLHPPQNQTNYSLSSIIAEKSRGRQHPSPVCLSCLLGLLASSVSYAPQ